MDQKSFDTITTFAASKGLIYGPEPEIYNGVAGFFTYGPLGKALKNNVENAIRDVFRKYDFWEVECPCVMPAIVWQASGHLGGFTDSVINCSKCKATFRVDKLIEEAFPDTGVNKEDYLTFIKDKDMKCPSCGSNFIFELKAHNLMMKTTLGLDIEAYNRPETATTTYLPFKRYLTFFRDKLPFGVFQIGKAFRNELSPRQNVLRCREFTQAEGQLFIFKDQKKEYERFERVADLKLPFVPHQNQMTDFKVEHVTLKDALKKGFMKSKAYAWSLAFTYELFRAMGIKEENLRLRQHKPDEKAFYADDAWDLEVKLQTIGWVECCGIHDRTDYDLTQHEKFSKIKLNARNIETNQTETPHVLEIAFGVDRPVFALIDNAYDFDKERDYVVMHFNPKIAPIKVAVFPLVNKLEEKAQEIYDTIPTTTTKIYDKSGAVGRRYARADEQGIPVCVTVDFQTLEDNTITLRNRDSKEQRRVNISDLNAEIQKMMDEMC